MHKRSSKGEIPISYTNLFGGVAAIVLFGYALSLASPQELARTARDQFAAASVSISVGVPTNPENSLAERLKEKSAQLDVQQQHIQELQQSLSTRANDTLGFYSLVSSLFLLLLVAVNFYLDWKRGGRTGGGLLTSPLTVNLRSSPR